MASSILWSMRRLGRSKLAFRIVHAAMRLVFPHGTVRAIRAGPLRGFKWLSHRDHQFWMSLGVYEPESAQWLASNLAEGCVFFDIGANAGYFTLLGSRCVGGGGHVYSFEPVPSNLEVLGQQVELNECHNVTLEAIALSNSTGKAEFAVEARNANSHLSEVSIGHAESAVEQRVVVQASTLDDYVESQQRSPDVLKIDVEGAEIMVLEGARETLKRARPRIILSTHSADLYERCSAILRELNYILVALPGFEHEILAYPRILIPPGTEHKHPQTVTDSHT